MAHKVRVFNSHWHLPKSKPLRIGLGIILVALGLLGFHRARLLDDPARLCPVGGPPHRRWRRQLTVWWYRRNDKEEGREEAS
ncbi:MAG: hypothetical protein R3D01_11160 [Hyphomicrobiales bacterium]